MAAELDFQLLPGVGHSISPRSRVRISPKRHRDTPCPGSALCPRDLPRVLTAPWRPSKALSGTEASPLGEQRLARSGRGKMSPKVMRPLAEAAVSWPGERGALFRASHHPLRCWQSTCKVRSRGHEGELHASTRHLQKERPPAPCPVCQPCSQHPCPPPPSGPASSTVKGTRRSGQTRGLFTLLFSSETAASSRYSLPRTFLCPHRSQTGPAAAPRLVPSVPPAALTFPKQC